MVASLAARLGRFPFARRVHLNGCVSVSFGTGLGLGESRGPIQFGVRDVGVVVTPKQPRPSSGAAAATSDMYLRHVTYPQLTLHTVEDLAASLVRRHDASMPSSAQIGSGRLESTVSL